MVYSVIGGDKRQIYLAELLSQAGHCVTVFATQMPDAHTGIHQATDLESALKHADGVFLPLPVSKDGMHLNAPFHNTPILLQSIPKLCNTSCIIFGGKIPAGLSNIGETAGIHIVDYATIEDLEILNAIPTAEGAIKIAIENTAFTLYRANILVTGFGRIGKVLARILKYMGANVTVSARKSSDLSWIEAENLTAVDTSDIAEILPNIDIVFNTVPHVIIGQKELEKCKKDVLLIDLATGGGVDFSFAEQQKIKCIHALSLPGKIAPKTSANIIYSTIERIIKKDPMIKKEWSSI